MIIYKTGNIFNSNAQVVTNTVNCVGVMGKGIALQFKNKFPEMFIYFHGSLTSQLALKIFLSLLHNF